MSRNIIEVIDRLKKELDELRPLPADVVARVAQKIRIESNYHSNALEGNTLTLGETRSLIMHGLTANGKPMRDHLDIEGHDHAIKAIEDAVVRDLALNGTFIRDLHKVLLKKPYKMKALTPDGQLTRRLISIGQYKSQPNNVETTTGEIHYYTPPEQVQSAMTDLVDWYRAREAGAEHPIVVAATFHYRFVGIHPFDDGNGRMARLLMNLILIRHGYTLAIIDRQERGRYIREIEDAAKTDSLSHFIDFIASCCEYTLRLHLSAARGESIEDADDIDREIALFKGSLGEYGKNDRGVEGLQYLETLVVPLREYCTRKLSLLVPGVFAGQMEELWSCKGQSSDGTPFLEYVSSGELPSIPGKVGYLSTEFSFTLQGLDVSGSGDIRIEIQGRYSADGSSWKFLVGRAWDEKYTRECANLGLVDLQLEFNDLLRWIMKDVTDRKQSDDGPDVAERQESDDGQDVAERKQSGGGKDVAERKQSDDGQDVAERKQSGGGKGVMARIRRRLGM